MQTFHTPAWMCPHCGTMLDAASYMGGVGVDASGNVNDDNRPGPGAFSICMECATILRFEKGMRLSIPEDADIADAPVEFLEILQGVQETVRRMHAERGHKPKTDASRVN